MKEAQYGPHTNAWRDLEHRARELSATSIQSLFDADPDRFGHFSAEAAGLLLDFSRQQIDAAALGSLVELAEATNVRGWIERMFAGFAINNTEDRAALHVALRRPADRPIFVDGEDVMPLVERERQKMRHLADSLHAGELKGAGGRAITDVVNIGIGGSDLGIAMAVQALAEDFAGYVAVHCVSNVDGVALAHLTRKLDPETTLFVICSKTFTTLETLTNARAAREWLLGHGGERAIEAQCIAVSTNDEAMDEFGIAPDKRFAIWDWVGGRYSMWSSVGLAIAHFETDLLDQNLPVLLALIGIWNRNFVGLMSQVVLPYDDHLARFPAYLQQLEMESNGKSVRRNGQPVECATCPAIWGEPGSNAQHSFMQLLHQGTDRFSVDFLLPARSRIGRQDAQDLAAANCLAQSWALAIGDPEYRDAGPHQAYSGNRPSTLLLFDQLEPESLGRLVALYEHKVFVQGVIWDVNSFDQWGVQLGKRLAGTLADAVLETDTDAAVMSGALGSLRRLRESGAPFRQPS